ncbi:MAG: HlyD family efflux transporter periplasmic adaptor subunit, partial [Candidatus Methylumidiphilus sp.]
ECPRSIGISARDPSEYADRQMLSDDWASWDARRAAVEQEVREVEVGIAGKRAVLVALARQEAIQSEVVRSLQSGGSLSQPGRILDEKVKLEAVKTQVTTVAGEVEAGVAHVRSLTLRGEVDLAGWRSERRKEASSVAAELAALLTDSAGADRVNRTEVRSPVGGVVQGVVVHDVGEVVRPGGDVASVVPDGEGLVAQVRISPRDRGGLMPGAAAIVRVTAYDSGRFGAVEGKLISISPDSEKDETRGERAYVGRIVSDSTVIDGRPIMIGMAVDVSIKTGRRTVLSYFASPIANGWTKALRER